jgi:TPP-dependent pyruvate/acetoin dehydrogenase alpha subunit
MGMPAGIDADVIMAEMYGKIEGCSLGRGGSMHLFDVSKTLWRQCYRQQSFTAGCRNGFSFKKQKKTISPVLAKERLQKANFTKR